LDDAITATKEALQRVDDKFTEKHKNIAERVTNIETDFRDQRKSVQIALIDVNKAMGNLQEAVLTKIDNVANAVNQLSELTHGVIQKSNRNTDDIKLLTEDVKIITGEIRTLARLQKTTCEIIEKSNPVLNKLEIETHCKILDKHDVDIKKALSATDKHRNQILKLLLSFAGSLILVILGGVFVW